MCTLKRICDAIEKTINISITLLLMLMTLVIFYQVVLRYVFQSANIWAEEFARYAFVWVVLLGSASAIRHFQHIRIDFAVTLFPKKAQAVIEVINYLLIAGFLIALIRYGYLITLRTGHQISAGMHLPISFMYLGIPISSAVMLLFTLEILLNKFVRSRAAAKTEG